MTDLHAIAIIDDYQDAARRFADWDDLPGRPDVTVFTEPLAERSDDIDAIADALAPFDVVVAMRERTAFPAALLDRLPKLRLLVTTGPVNAAIDVAAANSRGIVVAGTRPGGIQPTIELTWALILAGLRQLPAEDARVRDGGWQRTVGRDLYGHRLGLVGLGNVGSAVARIGQAFGMDVVAWSPHLDVQRAGELGVAAVSLDELLSASDVVSVHLKLSESTRGLLGARELSLLRPTAWLVNTSRGPIVDEEALLRTLHDGRIGGAALDVYGVEPLPADSPWRQAPRTVLSPHLGYVTEDTYRDFYGDAVEDIRAFAAAGDPLRVIDA